MTALDRDELIITTMLLITKRLDDIEKSLQEIQTSMSDHEMYTVTKIDDIQDVTDRIKSALSRMAY